MLQDSGEKALTTHSKKKERMIEGLKVCHVSSNQSSSHQCFLLLYVSTIGESVIERVLTR